MVKDLLLKVKVLTDQRKGFSVVQIRTSSQRTQQDQTETELWKNKRASQIRIKIFNEI